MCEFSKAKIWSIMLYLSRGVFACRTQFPRRCRGLAEWAPKQHVNLGWTLRAQSFLLEADTAGLVNSNLEALRTRVFANAPCQWRAHRGRRCQHRGFRVRFLVLDVMTSTAPSMRQAV